MQHKKLTADKSPKVTVTEKPSKINHSGRDRLNPMKHTGPEANVFNYHFPYPPSAEMHEVFQVQLSQVGKFGQTERAMRTFIIILFILLTQ